MTPSAWARCELAQEAEQSSPETLSRRLAGGMSPADIPGSVEAYIAGVGVFTLGELRAKRGPVLDTDTDTLAMWGRIATENLFPERQCPENTGGTRLARRASTA